MANQLKGTLYYLYTNVKFTLFIFWTIIAGVLALTLVSSYLMSEGTISFQLSLSVYVFCTIIGGWTVKNAIPYTVKLGSTRKNLYVSLGIYFLGFSLFNSIIANLINKIIDIFFGMNRIAGTVEITGSSNEKSFTFFHFAQFLAEDSWITYVFVDTAICYFLLSASFIVGLIFYKYGLIGGFAFLGIGMFTMIFGVAKGWLLKFILHVFTDFSIVFFYQLFVVGILVYLISFVFLRRITI